MDMLIRMTHIRQSKIFFLGVILENSILKRLIFGNDLVIHKMHVNTIISTFFVVLLDLSKPKEMNVLYELNYSKGFLKRFRC